MVSSDQYGYIIQDLIELYKDDVDINILIFQDYRKAFNSVKWGFIYETLHYFNFWNDLVQWIKTLYGNATFMIENNG